FQVKRECSVAALCLLANLRLNDSARRAGCFRLLLGRWVRLQPRAPFHVFFPRGDARMAVMWFHFVLVGFYHRTPEYSTGSAPAVEQDPIFEPLIRRCYTGVVTVTRCVWL